MNSRPVDGYQDMTNYESCWRASALRWAFNICPCIWCIAFLFISIATCSCGVSNDKHAGTLVPATKVEGLAIDDFKMFPQAGKPCSFNTNIWPGNDVTGPFDDEDAGAFCQAVGRVNRLGQCPRLFSDCSASDSTVCDSAPHLYYGSICARYVDLPEDPSGPFIRLAFDVSRTGVPASDPKIQPDAFACFFENLTSSTPLNVEALGLSHVSFWVRPWQPNTNLEISIVDSLNVETGPKKSLLDFNQGSFPKPGDRKTGQGDWTAVNVPITDLVPSTSAEGNHVNLTSLTQLGFCFANQHLTEIAGNTVMSGMIDINNISFQP